MPTAKELLARTRAKMWKSVDVGSDSETRDRSRIQDAREVDERVSSDEDDRDPPSDDDDLSPTDDRRKKWNWKKAFRKKKNNDKSGGSGSHRSSDQYDDTAEKPSSDDEDPDGDGDDDDEADHLTGNRGVVDHQVEVYSHEYDGSDEGQYRVQQRNNWQTKVADSKYWKKLMRAPVQSEAKQAPQDRWDTGLRSVGDVQVSSKYHRAEQVGVSPMHATQEFEGRKDYGRGRTQRRDSLDSDEQPLGESPRHPASDDEEGMVGEDKTVHIDGDVDDDDADYHHSSDEDRLDRDVDDEDCTNNTDDTAEDRRQRSSRYFNEQDDEVFANGNFSRASRHGSQHSNSSAMSIGAIGLPANVQPFRWVPYYGGANGFGYNPFAQMHRPFQPQQQPQQQQNYDYQHARQTPAGGAYDYDMGVVYSTQTPTPAPRDGRSSIGSATPTPLANARPGSIPSHEFGAYNTASVSPAYGYATNYGTPSPAAAYNGFSQKAGSGVNTPVATARHDTHTPYAGAYADTPVIGMGSGNGKLASGARIPSVFAPGQSTLSDEDNARVVAEAQRRENARQASAGVDVLGIGVAAPATPTCSPRLPSFYGPIGTLGLEASEKRQRLEASTGTEGHTVRAYRLAAAYPDLANLCGDGILMMTRMWCDPVMLTGAERVATPDLPELKAEGGLPNQLPAFAPTNGSGIATVVSNAAPPASTRVAAVAATSDAADKKKRKNSAKANKKTAGSAAVTPHAPNTAQARRGSGSVVGGKSVPSAGGSMHSMMGNSAYLGGSMAGMDSSMMGSMVGNEFMEEFADMQGSFVLDEDNDPYAEEASSDHATDSSSSAASSSDDEDRDEKARSSGHPQASRVMGYSISASASAEPTTQSRTADVNDASGFPMAPTTPSVSGPASRTSYTQASTGHSVTEKPTPSDLHAAKHKTAESSATARCPSAANASRRASVRRSSTADDDLGMALYEYGLDLSFNQYMNPVNNSPPPQDAGKPTTVDAAKPEAATTKAASELPSNAVKPQPAPTKTATTTATTTTKITAVPKKVAASPPPTPLSKRPASTTTSATASSATISAPPSTASTKRGSTLTNKNASGLSSAVADDQLNDLASLKRRNSKFLSNDLSGGSYDRTSRLKPLPQPPTTVAAATAKPAATATTTQTATAATNGAVVNNKTPSTPSEVRKTPSVLRPVGPSVSPATTTTTGTTSTTTGMTSTTSGTTSSASGTAPLKSAAAVPAASGAKVPYMNGAKPKTVVPAPARKVNRANGAYAPSRTSALPSTSAPATQNGK